MPDDILQRLRDSAATADDMRAAAERIVELETVCAESYQVLGVLASLAAIIHRPEIIRALDNLSDSALTHKDVLPFALPTLQSYVVIDDGSAHVVMEKDEEPTDPNQGSMN